MGPQHPQPVDVHGGSGGIAAQCDEMVALARQFGATATAALHASATMHSYLLDPGLTGSVLFDPGGWAAFEVDFLDALDGWHGVSRIGAQSGLVDGSLRAAAYTYEKADELYNDARDEVRGLVKEPGALLHATEKLVRSHDLLASAQVIVAEDPELADDLVHHLGIPGLLELGARALPDGHGVVHPLGTDTAAVAATPPRRLTDLLGELAHRNDDSHHGAIDVRIVTLADGTRRVIVDITGTKSWSIAPTSDITSLTTNGRALAGESTAYERGVFAAMRRAGVTKSDKVMIVGHSEGGMVAINAARDAVHNGKYNVTHVVTAGSPIGLTAGSVPRSVKVLALENSRDVVPHLDGAANPDKANVTTASSSRGDGTIAGDHAIKGAYVPVASDVEASTDPSLRDFLTSASDYLDGTSVTTHAYQVTRGY